VSRSRPGGASGGRSPPEAVDAGVDGTKPCCPSLPCMRVRETGGLSIARHLPGSSGYLDASEATRGVCHRAGATRRGRSTRPGGCRGPRAVPALVGLTSPGGEWPSRSVGALPRVEVETNERQLRQGGGQAEGERPHPARRSLSTKAYDDGSTAAALTFCRWGSVRMSGESSLRSQRCGAGRAGQPTDRSGEPVEVASADSRALHVSENTEQGVAIGAHRNRVPVMGTPDPVEGARVAVAAADVALWWTHHARPAL